MRAMQAARRYRRLLDVFVLGVLAACAPACRSRFEGGGDLRAQKVVLKREVEGYREAAARLERGDPVLPKEDLAIAISDALIRDLISAQLPFEADVVSQLMEYGALVSADPRFAPSS